MLNWRVFKRILWPERAKLFGVAGGGVALFGDLSTFATDTLTAPLLLTLFGLVAALFLVLCAKRALAVEPSNEAALQDVVQCVPCDGFRFSLIAVLVYMVLMAIGQGQSATEVIGEKLGLIEQKVDAIADDVSDLHSMAQPQMLVKNPKTDSDLFRNAWIYLNMQRDIPKAWESLQSLYEKFTPHKMDAAELYYAVGRQVIARDGLQKQMLAMGQAKKDGTLIVIAARNAMDQAEADSRYALARQIDPELPFGYWDVQRLESLRVPRVNDPQHMAEVYRGKRQRIETFLDKYTGRPPSAFYYIPQYQGDMEQPARNLISSYEQQIESYEKIQALRQRQGR